MKLFIMKGEDFDRREIVLFVADSMEQSVKLMSQMYDKWKHIYTKRTDIAHALDLAKYEWYAEQSAHLQWCEDTIDAMVAEQPSTVREKSPFSQGPISQITMLKRHQRNVSNVHLEDSLENERFMHNTWHAEAINQAFCLTGNKAECIERWKEQLTILESNTLLKFFAWT